MGPNESLEKEKQDIAPLQTTNGLAYQNAEKAEAQAESLEQQFRPTLKMPMKKKQKKQGIMQENMSDANTNTFFPSNTTLQRENVPL